MNIVLFTKKLNEAVYGKNMKYCLDAQCGFGAVLEEGTRFECYKCQQCWCVSCECTWHSGKTCEEYKNSRKEDEKKER